MNSISLQQVTENVKDLPSLPSIVMELLNDIDNEEVDILRLAEKVTSDLALTATTLRYANSAHFSTMIKVTTSPCNHQFVPVRKRIIERR